MNKTKSRAPYTYFITKREKCLEIIYLTARFLPWPPGGSSFAKTPVILVAIVVKKAVL
jgi:hypothetical protein